jgi:hypothetical protein
MSPKLLILIALLLTLNLITVGWIAVHRDLRPQPGRYTVVERDSKYITVFDTATGELAYFGCCDDDMAAFVQRLNFADPNRPNILRRETVPTAATAQKIIDEALKSLPKPK